MKTAARICFLKLESVALNRDTSALDSQKVHWKEESSTHLPGIQPLLNCTWRWEASKPAAVSKVPGNWEVVSISEFQRSFDFVSLRNGKVSEELGKSWVWGDTRGKRVFWEPLSAFDRGLYPSHSVPKRRQRLHPGFPSSHFTLLIL